jgi:hypothetical protein
MIARGASVPSACCTGFFPGERFSFVQPLGSDTEERVRGLLDAIYEKHQVDESTDERCAECGLTARRLVRGRSATGLRGMPGYPLCDTIAVALVLFLHQTHWTTYQGARLTMCLGCLDFARQVIRMNPINP